MDNESTELDMLAKMKAVMVKTQNVLVNINNFLGLRQRGSKIVWLYLGCLKGASKHCDFNLQAGQTCYLEQMILDTLVQGREAKP